MKRNLQHINEIRFLIIHIILVNHWSLNLFLLHVDYDHRISDIFIDLTSPLLAMISGYLFFYKTKSSLNYGKKLKSRFFSLVVPYLFWSLSFFMIYIVMKDIYTRVFHQTFWYSAEETLSFRNVFNAIIEPPLKNFWYLKNLILIAPLSIVIYALLKNRYVFFTVLALVTSLYMFKWHVGNWHSLYFDSRFLPYYLTGAYFGYNERYFPKIPIGRTATWLLLPVLLIVGLYSSYYKDSVFPILLIKVPIYTLYVLTLYNLLDSNQNSVAFQYLQKYQAYSFFLFAINMFAFSLVQRPLLALGASHYLHYPLFLFFFLILSLAGVCLFSFIVAGFLHKRFSRFYSAITGR